MSIMKNNKIIAVGDVNTYHPPILSCMWSDHIINDIQWLRADTFSWQSGDVYKTVYDKLVEEWTDWWATHTVDDREVENGVYFIRNASGYKIAGDVDEQNIINKYNTDGIAWYYILDITNKRFKLPRTKFGFKGLRTNAGDDIAESLPNIKAGNITIQDWGGQETQVTGAWGGSVVTNNNNVAGGTTANEYTINFDASRSSSTYQDNAPVQERATQMYLYFYVGEFAQTSIEQTAGLNSELFNGKLDKQSPTVSNGMTIESGQLIIGNTSSSLGSIELYGGNTTFGGFIDFHYGNSTADFSSRIIEHGDSFKIYNITGKPILLNDSNGVYLKYTYENGTSGYRIWTDGYCEQWGYSVGNVENETVAFLKTFANTNYDVQLTPVKNTSSIIGNGWGALTLATNSMVIRALDSQRPLKWRVCGYLASGQY